MINSKIIKIFKQGSTTYFYSSLFFPSKVREDVFKLYAFVRMADNFVDAIPQDEKGFYTFKAKYHEALNQGPIGDVVIDSFLDVMQRRKFDPEWVDAFLNSMQLDLSKAKYDTLKETVDYMYGSAEVIGLFMAAIMDLPKESYIYARHLGRAMQYINFIRDIAEDLRFGRRYLPLDIMKHYELTDLDNHTTSHHREGYIQFMRNEIERYCGWQRYAESGFHYIPKRYLIPIKTAGEMYYWTARKIYNDPYIVYETKVKPKPRRVIGTTLLNMIDTSTPKYRPIGACLSTPHPEQI